MQDNAFEKLLFGKHRCQFSRNEHLDALLESVRAALVPVEKTHNVKFRIGNIAYDRDDLYCRFPLIAYAKDEHGTIKTIEMRDLEDAFRKTEWLKDKSVTTPLEINGVIYFLRGYYPRSSKYAFLALRATDCALVRLSRRAVKRACDGE